jgi:hypothetical protein
LKAAVGEAMERLNGERRERERALPAHSIRPHQIMAIEEIETELARREREFRALEKALGT